MSYRLPPFCDLSPRKRRKKSPLKNFFQRGIFFVKLALKEKRMSKIRFSKEEQARLSIYPSLFAKRRKCETFGFCVYFDFLGLREGAIVLKRP